MFATFRTAAFALVLAIPLALEAQRGMGPRGPQAAGNPVAPLINMRRELNLTARQLTQLDSIEKAVLQRNEGVRTRLRARLDSAPLRRGRALTDEQRTAQRALADSMRSIRSGIQRNDSVARAAAMNVLTADQRAIVRERLAEQRGFAAGRRSAVRQGQQRGFRQGPAAPGIRGQQRPGMGGRMGMRGPGMGPGGGQRGPGAVGPRARPPADGFGPRGMRRMGPPDGQMSPDSADMRPMRRRMMGDPGQAGQPPRPPRPPADSGR